jgi:hypothetical protein
MVGENYTTNIEDVMFTMRTLLTKVLHSLWQI